MEHSWARVAAIVLMLGWIMPESLRAGAVLEAGEIDSSTVKLGAFAVVIYGQGERQPVSEDNQERLVTARGYIQALDWEQGWLILAVDRDGWQERIAFDRIQRLVLIGPHPQRSASRDRTQAEQGQLVLAREQSGGMDKLASDRVQTLTVIDTGNSVSGATLDSPLEDRRNMSTGARVALKLIAGICTGLAGGAIAASYCEDGQDLRCLGPAAYGYWVGNAFGVFVIDINGFDTPGPTLGSVISGLSAAFGGAAVGVIGGALSDSYPLVAISPVVCATVASEWLRSKSSANRRLSIGLAPNPRGSFSTVVALRF